MWAVYSKFNSNISRCWPRFLLNILNNLLIKLHVKYFPKNNYLIQTFNLCPRRKLLRTTEWSAKNSVEPNFSNSHWAHCGDRMGRSWRTTPTRISIYRNYSPLISVNSIIRRVPNGSTSSPALGGSGRKSVINGIVPISMIFIWVLLLKST